MKSLTNTLKVLIQSNAKAIVVLVVGAVLAVLGTVGVTGEMTVKEAVTFGVTAFLVWLTRNK